MTQYNVTFEKNGNYHANLITAETPEAIEQHFADDHTGTELIGYHEATADDQRPGKPCYTI